MDNFGQLKFRVIAMVILEKNEANGFWMSTAIFEYF